MASVALSLMVLAVLALVLGAAWLARRGAARKQIVLMLVLAAILAINVGIWTMPTTGGESLAEAAR
jgi:cyanate permease